MKQVHTKFGQLYISSLPTKMHFKHITNNFDIIWNLLEYNRDLLNFESNFSKKVLCANIRSYEIPRDANLFLSQLNEVVLSLKDNKKVLIHCHAGNIRTGMALACVKIKLDNLSFEDAILFSKKECYGPETSEQFLFVKDICSRSI